RPPWPSAARQPTDNAPQGRATAAAKPAPWLGASPGVRCGPRWMPHPGGAPVWSGAARTSRGYPTGPVAREGSRSPARRRRPASDSGPEGRSASGLLTIVGPGAGFQQEPVGAAPSVILLPYPAHFHGFRLHTTIDRN